MCKFCDAMTGNRRRDSILKKYEQDIERRYSVAIVSRMFKKGHRGARGSSTDYRYRGCGYALNFCPECGRKLKRNAVQTNYEHLLTLEHYEMANAILNIGEDSCKVCPRDREDRCNEDCNNGLVEWLAAPYSPNDPVWTEH